MAFTHLGAPADPVDPTLSTNVAINLHTAAARRCRGNFVPSRPATSLAWNLH